MSLKDEIVEATLDIDAELQSGLQSHHPACTHFLVAGKEITGIERLTSVGALALSIRHSIASDMKPSVDLKEILGETLEFELYETELIDQSKKRDSVRFRGKVERCADMLAERILIRRATVRVFDFIEECHELRNVEPRREGAGA